MSGISTHVLDLARGRPAAGVAVVLERRSGETETWNLLARQQTDDDGRVRSFPAGATAPGVYRLTFDLAAYFAVTGTETFYPEASVVFTVRDASQNHHVPLLLSPYGYSTYRGS